MSEEEKNNLPENTKPGEIEIFSPGKPPISFLVCNSCYIKEQCPLFEEDSAECNMEKLGEEMDLSNPQGIVEFIHSMLGLQARRIRRLAAFEEMEGGYPDPLVSEEIDKFVTIVEKLKKILSEESELVIRGRGASAEGLAEKLFGNLKGE